MPGLAERALRIIRECYANSGPDLTWHHILLNGHYASRETMRLLTWMRWYRAETEMTKKFEVPS